MANTFSDLLSAARLMTAGLKSAGQSLAKRGLDDAFVARLEASAQKAQALDNEQEALKAKLAAQTAALNANRDELLALIAEAKKLIKLDLPKTDWKQFGIADAR
jgi:fructose-1-phosphate kinase PfkB-like protein